MIAAGARLQLADRAILERIAQREGLPVAQFAVFDEAMPGPIEAVIAEWRTSVSHGTYLRRLTQILIALEREDNVLIVGRGAAFVLTDPGTLHVRVVAPMPCRIARLVQREGVSRSQAHRLLRASDEARARFVRQSFDADIDAPYHYDLTLNTAELSLEDAVEIILLGAGRKSQRRASAIEAPQDFLSHVLRFQRRPRFPRVSEIIWRHCERRSAP
jgi:cytidylate kinase